jgi:hemerythrin
LAWKDPYSVRIEEFDRQHREIVDCLNELAQALAEGMNDVLLTGILSRFTILVREHFSAEEEAMARTGYPDLEIHRLVHRLLGENLDFCMERLETNELILNNALLDFLRNWLDKHILGMDKRYSDFLNERGIF